MLKALKSCLIILSSIILLSTSVNAMTSQKFLYKHEDIIVKMCEDSEVRLQAVRNSMFGNLFRIPNHYECGLTSFYALHKVIEIMITIDRSSDDYEVFDVLMIKHYIEEYKTYNFIAIHLEFEKYLKEKKTSE